MDTHSDWSLTPEAMAAVTAEIDTRGSKEVVELGSGVSTLVIARQLRPAEGSLTSVEHDRDWAEEMEARLDDEELAGAARIVLAPLGPHPLALDGSGWYSPQALEQLPAAIDFLLVDGPPGNEAGIELSRYPALPALADRLAPGAAVVLDDAGRSGEREVLARWQAEFPVEFRPGAGGRLALGTYGEGSPG